jgi:hypothetical protein
MPRMWSRGLEPSGFLAQLEIREVALLSWRCQAVTRFKQALSIPEAVL